MLDFITAHPFGALVTGSTEHELFATHLPLLLDRRRGVHGVLQGHIARANSHHARLSDASPDALVLFTGPDAYVSPSFYPAKQRHGKVVPTWNYIAVHVYGKLRFVDDRDFMMQHLDALTDRHEGSQQHPWAMHDAPQDFLEQLVKSTVGLEIEFTRLEGKWKLSQNRSSEDIDGVIDGLAQSSSAHERDIAAQVHAHRPQR